jgi:heat shock protein HslJ
MFSRTHLSMLAGSLAVLGTISGCIGDGTDDSALSGTSWRFVEIDGAEPVDRAARLEFSGDTIGADVGCNALGGNWSIDNGRLIAGPLDATTMFCEGQVMAQERTVATMRGG